MDFETPFPREVKVGEQIKVEFRLWLTKGKFVESVEVWLMVPSEFDFPSVSSKWSQSEDYEIPRALTTTIRVGDVKKGITYSRKMAIVNRENPGKYPMIYCIYGKEYFGGRIRVEDAFVVTEEHESEG